MDNYAPVLILTLNRYTHFRRCVESLARCTHADKTEFFIALDYPANDTHWDGYKKIKEYCQNISGFKKVHILERTENYGVLKNDREARKVIYSRFDRLILTEDDNEFSPNFLDYINKGLDKFEDDGSILTVSGYCPLIKIPEIYDGNYFKQRRLSAWGFGIWEKKEIKLIYSPDEIANIAKKWNNAWKLYKRSPSHFISVLNALKQNRSLYGDMAYGLYMAMNEKTCCINPTVSLVRNHGHDGSGVHCANIKEGIYKLQEIDKEKEFSFVKPTQSNDLIQKELDVFFGVGFKGKVKIFVKYLLFQFSIVQKNQIQ